MFRHFGLKAIVVSKHYGFEPRLLFTHFCFEAAFLFKHFGWKTLQAKTFFNHFSFERFHSILCFNATLYCSNMFQATIFFKYVGGLKLGFEATLSLDFSRQTFFKKFWEKTKVCSEFFFCLIGSTASKQTILANILFSYYQCSWKKLKRMSNVWRILGWQETLHACKHFVSKFFRMLTAAVEIYK